MKMYDAPQSILNYLDCKLECSCGRTHYVPIKRVEIGSGVLRQLPKLVRELGYRRPYIICDENTKKIVGTECLELLSNNGIKADLLVIENLGFDEATLGEIVISMPDDCDLMIGCGTGSITDIVRYSSYKLHLPCFTVATGAPMDGFAASIGIMNVKRLKATMKAHCTEVIIGDTDILQTAPYRMTVAGFGDLIGKITCLNDWALARIINGEHYCIPNAMGFGYTRYAIGQSNSKNQLVKPQEAKKEKRYRLCHVAVGAARRGIPLTKEYNNSAGTVSLRCRRCFMLMF